MANPTKEQLEKLHQLQVQALEGIKKWVQYADAVNDYIVQVKADTVPPGTPPPIPPGH